MWLQGVAKDHQPTFFDLYFLLEREAERTIAQMRLSY